jgi:hypothetical protein
MRKFPIRAPFAPYLPIRLSHGPDGGTAGLAARSDAARRGLRTGHAGVAGAGGVAGPGRLLTVEDRCWQCRSKVRAIVGVLVDPTLTSDKQRVPAVRRGRPAARGRARRRTLAPAASAR